VLDYYRAQIGDRRTKREAGSARAPSVLRAD
jgi:hypothetical protein